MTWSDGYSGKIFRDEAEGSAKLEAGTRARAEAGEPGVGLGPAGSLLLP